MTDSNSSTPIAPQQRFKLRQQPLEVWSIRERLSLACSVLRSGDQNWVSVSRAIKPFGEPNRPAEWFSQKNCALQYSDLLEKVETPNRRKRGDRGEIETPGLQIVRNLTIERIEELKRTVQEEQQRYKKLKREVEEVESGKHDAVLQDMWEAVLAKVRAKEATENKGNVEEAVATSAVEGPSFTPSKPPLKKTPPKNLKLDVPPAPGILNVDVEPREQPQVEDVKQSPLLSHLLTTKTLLQQGQVTMVTPPSVSTVLPTIHPPTVHVKEEDSEPIAVAPPTIIKETTPLVTKITTAPLPTAVTTKAELPNSPSVGAPTLSMLLNHPSLNNQPPPSTVTMETEKESTTESTKVSEPTTLEPDQPETPSETDVPSTPAVEEDAQDVEQPETPVMTTRSPKPSIPTTDEETPSHFDQPPSPASSVVSNESVTGRRPGRRLKSRRGRPSNRSTRRSLAAEADDKQSELDSSDDETVSESGTEITFNASKLLSESIPNSPASLSQCSDTEDEKAYKVWKKSIMLVWRSAANHKYATVFLHPVTEDIAPGYTNIVYRPMDLASIKKNVECGKIRSTAEFQRDMMLMFTNAIMYNNSDHNVYNMAQEMYNDVMVHIEQYVHTQIMVQSEPKMLRTSRRSDAMSDKEDDSKRHRLSTDDEGGKTKKRKA